MRILYFYQYFTTPAGSWSTRCYEFSRRWVSAGDEVIVVTSVYDKSDLRPARLLSTQVIDGIEVRVINVRLSNKHGTLARLATFALYSLVATYYALTVRADVILCSSGPITVGLPGILARYLRGVPMVFEIRDLWPEGAVQLGALKNRLLIRLARWFESRCYLAADGLVALSTGMSEWLRRALPGRVIEVVPNAADLDLFRPNERNSGRANGGGAIVLYAGTLGLMDDCGQIVEAARVLEERGRRDVRLVLLGDGREREALEQRARGMPNIQFLGLQPKLEVAAWLGRATCALVTFRDLPVLGTVSPNKLFDAMAAGVPIVQTTRGWIRDLLAKEECGLSADPGDPDALAAAILRLVDEPLLRERMGRSARRLAESHFSRGALAGQMRTVLATAAAAGRKRGP